MARHLRSTPEPVFALGDRWIGRGHPSLVIAEAGVNHDGSVDKALALVEAAAGVGADAVKFQVFHAETLATRAAPAARYQREVSGATSQYDMLARLALDDDAFRAIGVRCRELGLLFIATPFSLADVSRAVTAGATALKIASTDLVSHPLLAAVAETGLPMIVSTGASTASEIQASVAFLRSKIKPDKLALLHCVSCYPTPIERINLRSIEVLREAFGLVTGLSDHTTSVDMGAWAVAAGASILEKHFTLTPAANGPDHAMSLTAEAMGCYIEKMKLLERAMGRKEMGMCAIEADVRRVARKSVVAAVNIGVGSVLTESMLAAKRPGSGIVSQHMPQLIGRRTRVAIERDTVLAWDMIE